MAAVGPAPKEMKNGEPPTPSPRSWTRTATRPACCGMMAHEGMPAHEGMEAHEGMKENS